MDPVSMEAPRTTEPPPPPPEPELNELSTGQTGALEAKGVASVQIRKNLEETVFFMPELKTDEEGRILVKFMMKEALTRWKFMGFAHTKDLEYAFTSQEIVTQKELMILPNAPRFLREGDAIFFTAKVNNMTEKSIKGQASLKLYNAANMHSVDAIFGNENQEITFETLAGQSTPLSWDLKIPDGKPMAIVYRVVAQSDEFSDGEENGLPVLSNRMLVTESMPMSIRPGKTKNYTFDRLNLMEESSSLRPHNFALEFTQNPAWYAVQALPYLMEYPYECTEQIFSRFYANSLAQAITDAHPNIRTVFDAWKDTDAMLSNLAKNEELKSALLKENTMGIKCSK